MSPTSLGEQQECERKVVGTSTSTRADQGRAETKVEAEARLLVRHDFGLVQGLLFAARELEMQRLVTLDKRRPDTRALTDIPHAAASSILPEEILARVVSRGHRGSSS